MRRTALRTRLGLRAIWLFRAGLLGAGLFGAAVPVANAQRIQTKIQPPPYYVGEPTLVQLVVQGFDEQPRPECKIQTPSPEIRAEVTSVAPNISVSRRMVMDSATRQPQIEETKSVAYVIECRITARGAGEYTVGPFVVSQNGKSVQVEARKFRFEQVPEDPDMRVRLILPDGPMYPGQRVAVEIEWWYAGDLEGVRNLRIRSPLFEQFRFAADPQPDGRANVLPIETADGQIGLEAQVRRETEGEKTFTVVSATRTMIPDRPGKTVIEPITASIQKVTEWGRARSPLDDFGFGGGAFGGLLGDRRRPTAVERRRAVGEPLDLVVKPFPSQGRPESFAGAVGTGFSIDVAADRSVVRVGDPITLDIRLRGDGNLENARLPKLSADDGLDPKRFQFAEQDLGGELEGREKRFRVTVRVQDESASEIPALAYSWFDPEAQAYATARSKPIALNVMPAKMITAEEVVSGNRTDASQTATRTADPPEGDPATSTETGVPRGLALSGVDLSIEQDPAVLLRDRDAGRSMLLQAVLYLMGVLAVLVAWVDRKRKQIPPEVVRRRQVLRQQRNRIRTAGQAPRKQGAEQIAAALRAVQAEVPTDARGRAEQLIAECESFAYAPGESGGSCVAPDLVKRALTIVDEMVKGIET